VPALAGVMSLKGIEEFPTVSLAKVHHINSLRLRHILITIGGYNDNLH
jgi:hypothetical protein